MLVNVIHRIERRTAQTGGDYTVIETITGGGSGFSNIQKRRGVYLFGNTPIKVRESNGRGRQSVGKETKKRKIRWYV